MKDYQDGYVNAGGTRIHYVEWGDPSKEPVILIHGLNVQAHTWDLVARGLAKDHRVIAPDLRGHGESDWSKNGYRVRTLMNDIAALVDELGIVAPFHLVGHSAGVRVAIAYAGEHADRVKTLSLSDAGPETTRAGAEYMRDFIQRTVSIRGFRNAQEAWDYYKNEHPEWVEELIDLHVEHQLRRNWAGKLVLKADPDVQWITGSASLPDIPYLWDMSAKATMPTLLMVGRTSNVLDEALVERMTTVMPNARAVWFETGHYVPREQPDKFLEELQAHFAEGQ
ncbi:alpha/beta fold hydrolase [Microbacterium suwonense]|uniref:Hydrolase n=1 Tax=Microbacterium suwonense TaxID=683047 RepID=A0ABN6X3K0_9MICO|nr:alpha/beta hydrolase [Microbacterium suwonense]BDZ39304.1 hydrolase [Microbacterium suwonense]